MEKDCSSAHHFRNFPRQKKVPYCACDLNADTVFLLCEAEL